MHEKVYKFSLILSAETRRHSSRKTVSVHYFVFYDKKLHEPVAWVPFSSRELSFVVVFVIVLFCIKQKSWDQHFSL